MIEGTISTIERRPYLQGRLLIPSLRIDGYVDFCVDTGADVTLLSLGDGQSLGIAYDALALPVHEMHGLGGEAPVSSISAVLLFREVLSQSIYDRLYAIKLNMLLPPADNKKEPEILRIPSLLGRDILRRWRMDCDFSKMRLRFFVRSADISIKR